MADLAHRKAADRWLTKLQDNVVAGDLSAVAEMTSSGVTPYLLTRFREQKLILRAPIGARKAVAELLRAAGDCLPSTDREAFDCYLRFSLTVDEARRRSIEKVHLRLRRMPRCSKAELLAVGQKVLDWYFAKVTKDVDVYSIGASVAERERRLHNLNGAVNDIVFAVARAINEFSRIATIETNRPLSKKLRSRVARTLREIVEVTGEVNSFEWLFDSVSYGDFVVEECADTQPPTFRLQFADARRHLLQSLAIRRELVMKLTERRNHRYVREKLEAVQKVVLENAVAHYQSEFVVATIADVDLASAEATARAFLMQIDAEDDLLLAASRLDSKIAVFYLVAMQMRLYALAARAVRAGPRAATRQALVSPAIPLAQIMNSIPGVDEALIMSALKNLTSELPARSHFALLSRPYIKDGPHVVRPLFSDDIGTWNVTVREALIQGGTLGKDVGAIWEDFYANLFADSDWKVLGRGVKLRRNGKILTDADLLLLRDDLLLVVQIKALTGSGLTVYDHWKNRQTIQLGCSQSRIAADFLESDPNTLMSICGKRDAARVKHVQPMVLSNLSYFDGWVFEGVPVAGEVTRKAICRGSMVEYFDGNSGKVLHTHHFVRQEDLTTEEILRLLTHPVELDIAAEGDEIEHSVIRVGELNLLMPEFVIQKNPDGRPAHEPRL